MRIQQGSISRLIAHSDGLRDKGEPERADEVLVEAALAQPLDAPDLLATLRRTLRASRADRVTKRLSRAPIEPRAAVARELLDARCEPDADALLESICAGGIGDIVRALTVFDVPAAYVAGDDAWWPQGERPGAVAADALCLRILESSAPTYDSLLAQLYASGLSGPAWHAASYLAAVQPLHAIELAIEFHRSGLHQGAESLIANVVVRTPTSAAAAVLAKLDDSVRREIETLLVAALTQHPDPHLVIDALRQVRAGVVADRLMVAVAQSGNASTLARLHDGLLSLGARRDADVVVARAGTRTDIAELCEALHRTSHHRLAYRIAEHAV